MGKSSGSTRASASNSPRGLDNAMRNAEIYRIAEQQMRALNEANPSGGNYNLNTNDNWSEGNLMRLMSGIPMPSKGQSIRISIGEDDDGLEHYSIVTSPRQAYVNDHYTVENFVGGNKVESHEVYYEFGGRFNETRGVQEHRTQNMTEASERVKKIIANNY